jgi:hypothetical protein
MIVNHLKKQGGVVFGILAMSGKTDLTADLRGSTRIIVSFSELAKKLTRRRRFRPAPYNHRFIRVNPRKSAV